MVMEALVARQGIKDHKRKHDSDDDEDDDDDEGPSAGSNQGRSTKRRRSDSAASGSAQPPPKDDDQSSKKPRESGASATKQHPALSSTGWQITDTRDAGADYSMHRSDPESEHSEQSSDDIPMKDEGNDSDMEDTDNAYIPTVIDTTCLVMGVDKSMEKLGHMVKTLHLYEYNKSMRLGSGQRMTAKKQRLHHSNREKDNRSKDLSKSRKACWRKNKRY
ncbi:hypothetical protein Tco_0952687 [Tanacetum coccineum]|uniref:Uncharacterized protein n=1 Tax=Tanacetum coccineum TaxID=301880 RepID=A0ABQ5DYH8_9ASTR